MLGDSYALLSEITSKFQTRLFYVLRDYSRLFIRRVARRIISFALATIDMEEKEVRTSQSGRSRRNLRSNFRIKCLRKTFNVKDMTLRW